MKPCYIYVIGREEGPVKVGITSAPQSRLATIQTGCPFKIELYYVRECRDRNHALEHESSFHGVNAEQRLAGEWFDLSAEYAAQEVDTGMDFELFWEEEERRETIAAHLNLWPWAGGDGAHPNH
jgi:predicted GIY-YIG superfamily endonuclease